MNKILSSILIVSFFTCFAFAKTQPLIKAAKAGNSAEVAKLLKSGVNKNLKDKNGLSALDWAIKNDYGDIAQMLYSNKKNKYIFLSPKNKAPIYMRLDKKGFTVKNKMLNKKVILFGAVSLYSFGRTAEAFDKFLKKSKIKPKNFIFLAMITKKSDYKKCLKIHSKLMKYTKFVYLNYSFYELLAKTVKYTGTPLFLLRDDKGNVLDGWVGWTIFANSKNFARLVK